MSLERKVFLDVVGSLETNCWILKTGLNFLVVDPGDCGTRIANWIKKNKADEAVTDIFLTHGHVDHTYGVKSFCKVMKDARIFASKKDLEFFNDPKLNRSEYTGQAVCLKELNDRMVFIDDGEILKIGRDDMKVLGLPGHTPGSIGLYSPQMKCVFVGDTLFKGSIGAANGPKSDFWSIVRSIKTKLLTLPDETVVLSGHGPTTTIKDEKEHNPFLKGDVA